MRLVPLRIPAGWTVVVNSFAAQSCSEDLLQLRAGELYLDLGWIGDRYQLALTEGAETHVRLESTSVEFVRNAIDLILGELSRDADPASLQRLLP